MTKLQLAGAASAVLMAASLAACNVTTQSKAPVDTGKIADAVKADAAQLIADFNAHDAAKEASHLASDSVAMFHGSPNVVGPAASQASSTKTFADIPDLHVTLADQTVDVAASGDMAVFRSTFVTTLTDPKTKKPVTDKGNYLAGYKLQSDGTWKQEWSVVSDTGPPPAAAPATPATKG